MIILISEARVGETLKKLKTKYMVGIIGIGVDDMMLI